jgi:hypothetical protein
MSSFKNVDILGYTKISGNLLTYSNVNICGGYTVGYSDFYFNGNDFPQQQWITYDIRQPIGNSISDDSWAVVQPLATSSWSRGLISKKIFRRSENLTLSFDFKGSTVNVMVGFINSDSFSFTYNQNPSELIYLKSTIDVYINGSSTATVYPTDAGDNTWHSYKIVLKNKGSEYYVDGVLIYISETNYNKNLKILINCYNGSKTYYFRNFKVYSNIKPVTLGFDKALMSNISQFSLVDIQTLSNSTAAITTTAERYYPGTASNSSNQRGLHAGGRNVPWTSTYNIIDYFTINNLNNAIDFGDLTYITYGVAGTSNATNDRGIFSGGYDYGALAIIQYVTISSLGNSTLFGNLTEYRYMLKSTSNYENNRGIHSGGSMAGSTPQYNIIDYVTINTTGNATDFGDLTITTNGPGSTSNGNSNRGIIAGGNDASTAALNFINYVTINTVGNGTTFGNLYQATSTIAADSNAEKNRGIFAGGSSSGINGYALSYITITTPGNATYFGNLNNTVNWCSISNS